MSLQAPIIGINRHRLATDGQGVTTLVAFHGCPLHCRYCLNPQCLDPGGAVRTVTPQDVAHELMIDNLYFLATGGGVTFGGGEPLLHPAFIAECARIMPPEWRVNIETCLNVPLPNLEQVMPHVSHFYVDIKDMAPDIYRAYTGQGNQRVLANLQWLARHMAPGQQATLRLPRIPNHNTAADVARSRATLQQLGFTQFDEFDYIIR